MKRKIRLTEGDLHRIVKKCVNNTLNEDFRSTYNVEPNRTIYKYLKEIQKGLEFNDFHIDRVCENFEEFISNIKGELTEYETKQLQKLLTMTWNIVVSAAKLDDYIDKFIYGG